ncbi:MAG: hypothetical protein ACRC1P_01080 [Cellulosilyticaceae bacterium]
MNIELTQEEFKALFDLVYAGNVLINGMRSVEERIAPHAALEQKIFSMAKDNGMEDAVAYDEEFKEYMPTHTYEASEVNGYIDAYDDQVFWEELVVRMARRDALNILGDENPDMSKVELNNLQLQLEEKYEEEVEYHGIERLKVVEMPLQSQPR